MSSDRGCIEVLSSQDDSRWREVLEEAGMYEFWQMPAYHRLAEMNGEGEAFMPVLRGAGQLMAFPLLLREIGGGDLAAGADLKDATSVRGFAGPVMSPGGVSEEFRRNFLRQMQELLEELGVVSVYSRLNPVLDLGWALRGWGEVVDIGPTLSIDLTLPLEEQASRFRESHAYELRRLRRLNVTCEEVGPEYVDALVRIHAETMDRVGAKSEYRVGKREFEFLLREMPDVMHLFVCKYEGVVTSAGLCGACGGMMAGYAAGTLSEFRKLAPMKLLYDGVREWATERGFKEFHLGGGVGAERDSLFAFKLGFGPREFPYRNWRCVVDPQAYGDLCRAAGVEPGDAANEAFFPAYRGLRVPQLEEEVTSR